MSSAPATAAQDNLSQLTFSDSLTPDQNLLCFKLEQAFNNQPPLIIGHLPSNDHVVF